MAVKKRGLGRGLDALLGATGGAGESGDRHQGDLRHLDVDQLERGRFQPRTHIDPQALEELAGSIRAQGVVQPIVVRELEAGRYEIVAGERRWHGARLAGLTSIPALVRDVSDRTAMALALVENIQREALNPLEEALALKRLVEECSLTHQQVADAVGRSRAAVSNLLRLLELDTEVQALLREQKLEMGHARALLALDAALQREAARQILVRGLSVREVEQLVRQLQGAAPGEATPRRPGLDPDIRVLQEDLSQRLGAKVRVQHSATGKGRLVIHYNSLDELDGIIAHVGK